MKKIVTLSLLLILTDLSYSQRHRLANESVNTFITRLKPDNASITNKIIETKWNNQPVIIAFYDQLYKLPKESDPDQQDYHRIIGILFVENSKNNYNRYIIDTIDTEGGDPKIESIFFANCDKDKSKELLLIVSWNQVHYEVEGILYDTLVFDNILPPPNKNLMALEKINKKFEEECECSWSDGTSKVAKFKSAAAVKKELVRLGYKQ